MCDTQIKFDLNQFKLNYHEPKIKLNLDLFASFKSWQITIRYTRLWTFDLLYLVNVYWRRQQQQKISSIDVDPVVVWHDYH